MKKVLSILVLFGVLFFMQNGVFAFDQDDSLKFNKNTQYKDVYSEKVYHTLLSIFNKVDENMEMIWNEESGLPSTIVGNVKKADKDAPVNELTRALPAGMTLKTVKSFKDHTRYNYYQNGRLIFPSDLTYSSDSKGNFMMSGNYPLDNHITNKVVFDSFSAQKAAFNYLGATEKRMNTKAEKVYFNTRKDLKNAYMFKIASKKPLGDFVVVVDAETADILYCDNMMSFYQGTLSTFKSNPLKCDITNEDALNINTNTHLYGKYFNAINEDTDYYINANNSFIYPQDNTHFDEANVYFHINRIHDFYKDVMGYNGLDKAMKATVHYRDHYDNAFFSPWSHSFSFGDGNKFNDLAEEASVIYHEYTHAVTGDLAGLGTSGEAGGMNEGYSDYFGNTLTNDPDIGEWACAKMGRDYLRSCKNKTHYPEDIKHECHADSLMWSAPLWEIREAYGATIADKIIHFSRYYINNSSKFADGLQGILKADEDKFGGVHKAKIISIFRKRGIMASNDKEFRSRMREKEIFNKLYKIN